MRRGWWSVMLIVLLLAVGCAGNNTNGRNENNGLLERRSSRDRNEDVGLTGRISAIDNDDEIVIGDQRILIDRDTDFAGDDFDEDDLEVGDVVRVEGERLSDDSLVAHRIERARSAARTEDVELTGRIDALDDDGEIVIGGQRILIDDDTDFAGDDFDEDDLRVDDVVRVEGERLSGDSLLAHRIERARGAARTEEVKFTGRIDAIFDDGRYSIEGETVYADNETKFDDVNPQDLQVGSLVEIKGWRQSDGSVLAEKIELEDGRDDGPPGRRDDDDTPPGLRSQPPGNP